MAKLKDTHINNTLCDPTKPVKFPPIRFPRSVMSYAVHPHTAKDEEKISVALHRLIEEDPTFHMERNPNTKELVISGMGDQHLAVVVDNLKKRLGVNVDLSTPKVDYKETITAKGDGHYKHKKQSGGHGQYGEAYVKIEPQQRGKGFEFASEVVGGSIPRNFIPAVEKGCMEGMQGGAEYALGIGAAQAQLGYTLRTQDRTWPAASPVLPDNIMGPSLVGSNVRFGDEIPGRSAWSCGPGRSPRRWTPGLGRPGKRPFTGRFRRVPWRHSASTVRAQAGSLPCSWPWTTASHWVTTAMCTWSQASTSASTTPWGSHRFERSRLSGGPRDSHDCDGDGVPDDVDECPDLPEDRDGIQDGDGCPEDDADGDGILDTQDACPLVAGVESAEPGKNGCPPGRDAGATHR